MEFPLASRASGTVKLYYTIREFETYKNGGSGGPWEPAAQCGECLDTVFSVFLAQEGHGIAY